MASNVISNGIASNSETNSAKDNKSVFTQLEVFRRHAISVIGDQKRLTAEFMAAKQQAEGNIGYRDRITPMLPHVRKKNRYLNIVTLEDTRVRLRNVVENNGVATSMETVDGDDYINASYIRDNICQDRAAYIATQGPLTSTAADFWRMCVEQNSSFILMLTPFMEGGRQKVDPYFPQNSGEKIVFDELLSVFCVSVESVVICRDSDSLVKRVFEIQLGAKKVSITHYHFKVWPDFGNVSETSTLLALLDLVDRACRQNQSGPLVTHCSAGVGRTGTFLAIDIIRRNLRQTPDYDIDVRKVVSDLRNQRPQMVMTIEQYGMIYRALFLWLFDEDLTANIQNSTVVLTDEEMYRNGMKTVAKFSNS